MEKLPICRICLAENTRMYVLVNRNLHELYEKLTDIPFVTEDSRPILACFFCCAKLKQCYQLLRQCMKAEECFAQIMKEDYEPNLLINQDHLEFCSRFIKSPIVHISILDVCQTESIDIKEELQAGCEGLGDVIEPKEEHQHDELELENFDNRCLDVADTPPHHSESDLEDDEPLIELKTEVKDEEVTQKKQRARNTKRTTIAKKPKQDIRRTKLEDAMTAEQMKKEKSYKCDVCQRSFNEKASLIKHIRIHTGGKSYKCDVCQRSFNEKASLIKHIRIHTGEKPYKCDVCQRSFSENSSLTKHIRIHTGDKPYI